MFFVAEFPRARSGGRQGLARAREVGRTGCRSAAAALAVFNRGARALLRRCWISFLLSAGPNSFLPGVASFIAAARETRESARARTPRGPYINGDAAMVTTTLRARLRQLSPRSYGVERKWCAYSSRPPTTLLYKKERKNEAFCRSRWSFFFFFTFAGNCVSRFIYKCHKNGGTFPYNVTRCRGRKSEPLECGCAVARGPDTPRST